MQTSFEKSTVTVRGQLIAVSSLNFDEFEDQILQVLEQQPASYETFYTTQEMLDRVQHGLLNFWLLVMEGELKGGLGFTIEQYTETTRTIKVDFVSCKNFHTMTLLLPYLKKLGLELGCSYLEGVAHPTIAEYLVKKAGFSASGVYVSTPILNERRN